MSEEFYKLVKEIHEENKVNEWNKQNSAKGKALWEMTLFEIHCRINNKNPNSFEDFIKYSQSLKEDEKIHACLIKIIAEEYFDKKFKFNYETKKWQEIKAVQINMEKMKKENINNQVNYLYSYFSIWCRINKKNNNDFHNFKLFINDTNQEINFWIKKKFFEKFFNFEFFYNYEEEKWFYKRSKNERTK